MPKLAFIALMAVVLVTDSCSRSLHGGKDAGRDGRPLDCAGPPPEACGYLCQDGQWVRTSTSCLPDGAILDAGDGDAKVADAPGTGGAAGGATGTGGATASGGAAASGGRTASGGMVVGGASAAGATITGGASTSGGTTATGGTSTTGGATSMGGSRAPGDGGACANIAGSWRLTGACMGPRAWFNGSVPVEMEQTGCDLSLRQIDDQGVTTGRLESTGQGYLKGSFGFTDSNMCDLTVTAEGWDMVCASAMQFCNLQARPIP